MKKRLNKKQQWACILAVSALLGQSSVYAAEEEVPEEYSFDQVVVTATRTPQKIAKTAANVTVVTKEQIENGHFQNVGQVLEHIPGVLLGSNGSSGSPSAAFINGTEKIVVMIDGRRMNLPNGIGALGDATTDLTNLISVENIEKIEVVKGGGSALYGPDAVGGVIHIITKKGIENKTTITTASGSEANYNTSFTTQGKNDDFSWYVTAKQQHQGDYAPGGKQKIPYSSNFGENYTVRFDQRLKQNDNISLYYEYANTEAEMKNPGAYSNDEQRNIDVTYTGNINETNDYQVKLYRNMNHRFGRDSYEAFNSDVTTNGLNYQWNYRGINKHIVTTGMEWRQDQLDSLKYGDKSNINQAWYLQDQWDMNTYWSLTTGVRLDKNHTYGSKTTPHIAVNYQQDQRTSYFASWGQVFRSPRFDDLYWPYTHYAANPAWGSLESEYKGNPDLQPETGWSLEAGIKHNFDDSLQGKLTYFKRKLDNVLRWSNVSTDPTKEYWTIVNGDKQEADGVEIEMTKQLTPNINIYTAYNYTNVKNKKGNSTEYIKDDKLPDSTWNVGINYKDQTVTAGLKGTSVSGLSNSSYKEKSYWLWDANVNVKLSSQYEAFFTVNNIFDQFYEKTPNYPCAGRQYLIGVKASF